MQLLYWLAAGPYNITANDIGLPTSTHNLGEALANGTRLLMVLVGMLSVVFIVAGGIQMVYSRGNASNVTKARETILYACIGLVVAIAAYAIVTFILAGIEHT